MNPTTLVRDMAMHWFDTTILTLLVLGAIFGAWSGFVWQIARILTLGLAIYGAVLFHEPASEVLRESALQGADVRVITTTAYVLVFLISYLILFYSARVLRDGIRAADLQMFDRLLGAAFGAGKIALGCGGL